MTEQKYHSEFGALSEENLRKLEKMRQRLSAADSHGQETSQDGLNLSISFDKNGQDLPLTEFPPAKPLEINSIDLSSAGRFKELTKKVALLKEKEKEAIRKSPDYQILKVNTKALISNSLKPDDATDDFIKSIFGEESIDPLTIALFLNDYGETDHGRSAALLDKLEELDRLSKIRKQEENNTRQSLLDEGTYLENLRSSDIEINLDKKKEDYFKTAEYAFLTQLYVQGMEPEEMEARLLVNEPDAENKKVLEVLDNLATRFADFAEVRSKISINDWNSRVRQFIDQAKLARDNPGSNIDPAGVLFSEMVLLQPGLDRNKLNTETIEKSNEKFVEQMKDLLNDFYYSGRWRYDSKSGECVLGKDADLDAATSLWFFKRAGMKAAIDAQAMAHGQELKAGGVHIDLGYVTGAVIDQSSNEKKPTIRLDNHFQGRTIQETSAAKIIYRMMSGASVLSQEDKNNPALRALVEMTVLDDNAGLLDRNKKINMPPDENHPKPWILHLARDQFEKSGDTLRGLASYFCKDRKALEKNKDGADALFRYLSQHWAEALEMVNKDRAIKDKNNWWNHFGKILDRRFNKKDIEEFGLVKAVQDRKFTISAARKLLSNRKRDDLIKEGRVLRTRFGDYLVNISGLEPTGGLKGGFVTAMAYGYKGIINFDPRENQQSFMVNTLHRDLDLNKAWALSDGVPVRGTMVVKQADGKPLKISLKDILDFMAPGYSNDPQGLIKQYLEHGLPKSIVAKQITDQASPVSKIPPVDLSRAELPLIELKNSDKTVEQTEKKKYNQEVPIKEHKKNLIEFTEPLNNDELRTKDGIDDKVFELLTVKAKKHPGYSMAADKEQFLEGFISQGFKHQSIIDYLRSQYKEKGLPVKE